MMTPLNNFESIIRQYEWYELSEEQKAEIAGIAADEQAFNTAKSILLLASEEKSKVPLLKPDMAAAFSDKFARKKKTVSPVWYAAAASVVLAAVGLWVYKQDTKDKPFVIHTNPVPGITEPQSKDTQLQPVPVPDTVSVLQTEKQELAQKTAPDQNAPLITVPEEEKQISPVKEKPEPVFMVANDPKYLDLLTELY